MPQSSCLTPLGDLTVSEEDGAIVALDWGRGRDQTRSPLLDRAIDQIQAYFDGARRDFELPLAPQGTAFQRRLWAALRDIPFGHTRSYAALARGLGSSPRAVGRACGANPIPLLIPCHRVLAAGGGLGGYSGGDGPPTKAWLLAHEQQALGARPGGPTRNVQSDLPLGPGRTSQAWITIR